MKKSKTAGEKYDLVIVGAGVAGLSAAMYAARLGLKTICFGSSHGSEMPIGGVITTTKSVENYPGFESIDGAELAEKIRKQAESYKLVTIKEEKAEKADKKNSDFVVNTDKGSYSGKTLLFATGTMWRKLDIPGGREFENRGIAYCALCDAPLFKNKTVAVIGGSDSAAKDALILAEHAKKVFILYRGEKIRAEPVTLKKIMENNKIEIVSKINVTKIEGDKVVKKAILDKEFNGSRELEVQGIFVAIGHVPLTDVAKELGVELNEKNEIKINHKTSETSIKGVYAAGDVTDKPFKQAIIGVAEGCTAAYSAFNYLTKESI